MAEPMFWPTGLPQSPSKSAYSKGLSNNTIRTAMEFGPAKTRRRTSAMPSTISAQYLLQKKQPCPQRGEVVDQKVLFEQFYAIVDCHTSFYLPNPENLNEYILVRIKPSGEEAGVSLQSLTASVWTLTLNLEVHPLVPAKPRS